MRGLLRNIVVLLVSVFVCGSVMGATYTSKSSTNPGYKFEEDASWNGGSKPGSYAGSIFTVSDGTTININGYVALNGSLNWASDAFFSSSTLNIKKNSILVIDGNFNISDRVDVILEENATLYIKGDFITHDNSIALQYCDFQIGKFSNVVVEGNVTSASGASVCIYRENGNADFYIFGTRTGNIYKKNHSYDVFAKGDGSSYLEDEQDYNDNEEALIQTVSTISSELLLSDCILHIAANEIVRIDSEIEICGIDMKSSSTLIIEESGILKIKNGNDITFDKGMVTNFGHIQSANNITVLPKERNGVNNYFYNNGIITVDNFYMGRGNEDQAKVDLFNFSCGSSIIATHNIEFTILGWTGDMELLGNYSADKMIVDYQSGGKAVHFGSDCGTSKVELKELTLKNNVSEVNINEITGLEKLTLETYSAVQTKVDGSLVIGQISASNNQSLGITGTENSVISFCWNPTHGKDFGGDGKDVKTKGIVIYRYDDSDNVHSWYTDGSNNSPVTERDVTCDNCTLKANGVGFASCMSGENNFLPIVLVSFFFDKSRNEFVWTTASETNNDYFVVEYSKNGKNWVECTEHVPSQSDNGYTYGTEPIMLINESLFSYFRLKQVDLNGEFSYSDVITISFTVENPCSEEYEDSKMQIREFGNRYYRLINGELIYCENDNE